MWPFSKSHIPANCHEAIDKLATVVQEIKRTQDILVKKLDILSKYHVKDHGRLKFLYKEVKEMKASINSLNSRAATAPPENHLSESDDNYASAPEYIMSSDEEEELADLNPHKISDGPIFHTASHKNKSSSQAPSQPNQIMLFDPLSGISIPVYDPSSETPDGFLGQVEEFLTLKNIPLDNWHRLVGKMLKEGSDVMAWWKAKRGQINSWNDFKYQFREYENAETSADVLTEKLFNKKQKFNEPFESYCWSVLRLFRRIQPDVAESVVVERIVNSCLPELSVHLQITRCQNVEELAAEGRQLIKNMNRTRSFQKQPLFRARETDPVHSFQHNTKRGGSLFRSQNSVRFENKIVEGGVAPTSSSSISSTFSKQVQPHNNMLSNANASSQKNGNSSSSSNIRTSSRYENRQSSAGRNNQPTSNEPAGSTNYAHRFYCRFCKKTGHTENYCESKRAQAHTMQACSNQFVPNQHNNSSSSNQPNAYDRVPSFNATSMNNTGNQIRGEVPRSLFSSRLSYQK